MRVVCILSEPAGTPSAHSEGVVRSEHSRQEVPSCAAGAQTIRPTAFALGTRGVAASSADGLGLRSGQVSGEPISGGAGRAETGAGGA